MTGADGFVCDVVVVGAGIAGLCAAGELVRAGRRVLIIEKSRGVGGRMATRRVGAAVCDHGAQFFTVRQPEFGGIVAAAQEAGAVVEWCAGFLREGSISGESGSTREIAAAPDGHPRWRGVRGMTDLPKRLAESLTDAAAGGRCRILTNTKVTAIGAAGGGVRIAVERDSGVETITAGGAVLTSPVPQTLDLLAAGGLLDGDHPDSIQSAGGSVVAPETRRLLESVDYDPCFALVLVLDRPSRVPPPGGIQFAAEARGPIAWLADNQQKGTSPVPALTVHATGAFSRAHFERPQEEVADLLIDAVRPWIDGDPAIAVVDRSLHRWKFALPTTVIPAPLVAALTTPPIVCCGDAFAGPRVEGAATSGLATGRWMHGVLQQCTAAP